MSQTPVDEHPDAPCFTSQRDDESATAGCGDENLSFMDCLRHFENKTDHSLNECSSPPGLSPAGANQFLELDFHCLFKEVIKRGGHQKVTREGKWVEIASALNIVAPLPNISIALQQHYLNYLQAFEHNRPFAAPSSTGNFRHQVGEIIEGRVYSKADEEYLITVCFCSKSIDGLLREFTDYRLEQLSIVPGPIQISNSNIPENSQGLEIKISMTRDKKRSSAGSTEALKRSSKGKGKRASESKMDPSAPRRNRNAYRIFFDKEYNRLKNQIDSPPVQNIRRHLNDKWKSLSTNDRQPYIEEGSREKEIYQSEMEAYRRRTTMQTCPEIGASSQSRLDETLDDYSVLLETHAGEEGIETCRLGEATATLEVDDTRLHETTPM